VFTLAEAGQKISDLPVTDWPWSWVRIASYVKVVVSVYQRTFMDKEPDTALPLEYMWFRSKLLDKWFEDRRTQQREDEDANRQGS
jgi:hypothetical protein